MKHNIILNSDSYKTSHFAQLGPNTTHISSYIESRGSGVKGWNETTVFGLQMLIKQYLLEPITSEMIDEAKEVTEAHGLPFNEAGWKHILDKHNGFLPLSIQSVAEGTNLPLGNVMVQIINTDPKVPWLTNFIETLLLRGIWYGTTIASQDLFIKREIKASMERTSDSQNIDADILFKLHDFGARGVSSLESAGIGGCSHLIHFLGTDTMSGLLHARRYYGEQMAGYSIPATEHSTICAWGGESNEIDAFTNMLNKFGKKDALLAVVSDTYDIMKACEKWFSLKDEIVESGACVIIRPDSGCPWEMVPKVLDKLMSLFGYSTNSKGFKVLPDYLRVIQGDGINYHSIVKILFAMELKGQSTDNIAFGMGGAMLQQVNRDTFQFAMKASQVTINGKKLDICKNPVTDAGKRSKPGRLALIKNDGGEYQTIKEELLFGSENLLQEVYRDGKLLIETTLAEVRERAASTL